MTTLVIYAKQTIQFNYVWQYLKKSEVRQEMGKLFTALKRPNLQMVSLLVHSNIAFQKIDKNEKPCILVIQRWAIGISVGRCTI